jgi:hypothetical protein
MATSPKTYAINPKEWRLFKTWVSLTPLSTFTGDDIPRLGAYREMGNMAVKAYNQLRANALIKLPEPPASATTGAGSVISGLTGSFNYTPQIGNTPAYIFVEGHFHSTSDIKDPYSMKPVFSGGVLYDIPSHSPANNPTMVAPNANLIADMVQLRGIIEADMTASLPSGVEHNVDKIDYLGIIFGTGGLHFPQ